MKTIGRSLSVLLTALLIISTTQIQAQGLKGDKGKKNEKKGSSSSSSSDGGMAGYKTGIGRVEDMKVA